MENRLRLLVVDEEIIDGGVETIRVNLIPELSRLCESVVWVLPQPAASSFRQKIPEIANLQIEDLNWPRRTLPWLGVALARRFPEPVSRSRIKASVLRRITNERLRLVARQNRAECFLTTCVFSQPPPDTELPIVGVICDVNPSIPDAIKKNMLRWLETAHAILAISEFTRKELGRMAPEYASKIHVMPLAVAALKLAPASAVVGQRFDFYMPAASNPHKGHLIFFRACLLLARRGLDYRAVLSGPGMDGFLAGKSLGNPSMEEARQFLVEHSGELGKRITIAGDVSAAEIESLYASARCIVLPSRYEGFGLPLAEALIRGKEIICSNIPSFAEQVMTYDAFNQVHFVEAGDFEEFADAMQASVKTSKLNNSEEVSRRVRRWTWTDVARRCYEVLAADL